MLEVRRIFGSPERYRSILNAVLIATSLSPTVAGALECDHAYTRLEHAVCDSTQLQSLQREFDHLASSAVERNRITRAERQALQNHTASRCRSAVALQRCLTRQLLGNIAQLGGTFDEPALAAAHTGQNSLIGDPSTQLASSNIERQGATPPLAAASASKDWRQHRKGRGLEMAEHGEIALLEIYRQQIAAINQQSTSDRNDEISQTDAIVSLRKNWRSACAAPQKHAELLRRLEWYGLFCGR